MSSDHDWLAGFDIGGTKLTTAIGNASTGEILYCRTPILLTGSDDAVPNQLRRCLNRLLDHRKLKPSKVCRVGISVASLLQVSDGSIEAVGSNLCGGMAPGANRLPNDWLRIPIEAESRKWSSELRIVNDAVAALFAELQFGAGRPNGHVVLCNWGTGIGFGASSKGQLLLGKNGNAGHAGHQVVSEQYSYLCGCGSTGDLESCAGGWALERRAGKEVAAIFAHAANGNSNDCLLLEDAIRSVARGLYNVSTVLDPDTIILSGSIFEQQFDYILPRLRAEYLRRLPIITGTVDIVPASLGNCIDVLSGLSLVIPSENAATWRQGSVWENASRVH